MADFKEELASDFSLLSKVSQSFVSFTGATGIAGFKFDISNDEEVNLSSDITDHYTENNVPVQDNIVNNPIKVTLRGLVGEYKYNKPHNESMFDKITNGLQNATKKLITISAYLPSLSDFTMQSIDNYNSNKSYFDKVLDISVDAFKLYRNVNVPSNKQTSAFLYFEALWASKQTFTIQTPFRFYTNMAVETLKAVQHGDTDDNTDFEITFKQIRKVTSDSVMSDLLQGRLKEQSSGYINKGIAYTKEVATNKIKQWFGGQNATNS